MLHRSHEIAAHHGIIVIVLNCFEQGRVPDIDISVTGSREFVRVDVEQPDRVPYRTRGCRFCMPCDRRPWYHSRTSIDARQ
jgi:hypothetical protein